MKNNYYIIARFYDYKLKHHETLFGSVKELLECQAGGIQNSLFGAATVIYIYFKSAKAQFAWNGSGFRRTSHYDGGMKNYGAFNDKFCEFGEEGCLLVDRE